MESRERLRRCYAHEETDRPAVCFWASYPVGDATYDGLRAYVESHSDLKPGWNATGVENPYPVEERVEPHSTDFDRIVFTLNTPSGPLRSSQLYDRGNRTRLHEEFFIKNREDGERYLSLPFPELTGDVSGFFELDGKIGSRGIVDARLGFNPAGAVAELMGSEAFALFSVTERDLIHALCLRESKILAARLTYLLERNVGPFFSMLGEEYVVPPLHGPEDFHDFNERYDKPIIDRIHDAGGWVRIHCHGRVGKVLEQFAAMGVDVLHPVEAPPMGDVSPAEAKKMIRGRVCFEGNIQIASMYKETPEAIRGYVNALIRDVFDDGKGLIVCPTASPFLRERGLDCIEQYRAMIETVVRWRPAAP